MIKESFDAGWEYNEMQGMMAQMFAPWEPVHLPHDASISKPRSAAHPTGSGGGYFWSGVVNYRKKFIVPEEWRGQSVQLEFEGVYQYAEVSINHHLVTLHPYGYTSFVVDLTPYLNYGAENEVRVTANNSAQPNSRWYSGTGIYRHVWLRRGGSVHIPPWGVFVTTPVVDPAASTVQAATEISRLDGSAQGAVLRSTILDASGATAAQVETPVQDEPIIQQTLTVENARLWSLDEPNLYTLVSEVLVKGEVVDTEHTTFGIRSIAVDAQNGFRLNGAPLKLKGGCVHHDNGLLGAASYDRAEERKVELMKSAGFNAVRCAHNPPAPAFLDACDRLGMLVVDESFDCWRMGKNPNDYHLVFEDWWQRDVESMVKRDRNHPSIIMWSIGNEVPERTGVSDGYALAKKQVDLIRSLDDTRLLNASAPALFETFTPALAQSGFEKIFDFLTGEEPDPQKDHYGDLTEPFFRSLDVAGYNYVVKRYEADGEKFPGRVIAGTETFPLLAYTFWEKTARLPYVIGDFVWTSIDYLGEAGIGQVVIDGPMPFIGAPYPYHLANCGDFDICGFKRPQSYFRDILWGVRKTPYIGVLDPQHYGKQISFNLWGWDPVIASWSFPGWEGKPTRVDVYSAAEEVELLVNGVSVGRKSAGASSQNKAVFEVTYQPGVIEAVGYTNGKESGRTTLKTAAKAAALRLTSDRPNLRTEYGDLAYVTVKVVDPEGNLVPYAEPKVDFEITGVGELIAVGTADPVSEELYVGNVRKAWNGRLMAVVRSTGEVGEIRLKAQADGLATAEVQLLAK